jgi:BNR repeat-like domain
MKRATSMIAVLWFLFFAPPSRAQWTPAQRLTWNPGFSYFPAIAVDSSGDLQVVWQDDTPGNPEIYYRKSTDGGSTWTTSKRLTVNSGYSRRPAIAAVSSDTLAVVWSDNTPGNSELFSKRSTDGGAGWTTAKRMTWTSGSSEDPVMALDLSGNLHLVCTESTSGNDEIYYKKSSDGGSTWTTSRRLSWTSGYSLNPAIAADSSGHLHVIWRDDTPGNFEVYYKKSTDGGTSWSAGKRLTWTSAESGSPAAIVDPSGYLHVVWRDYASDHWEIYYKRSTDGGAGWTTGRRLTWTSGDSVDPDIAVDNSGYLHLVWSCLVPAAGAHLDYQKSTDAGSSWTSAQRLTWGSGLPCLPVIASDSSGDLHLVWYLTTPDNSEIYYKKYMK